MANNTTVNKVVINNNTVLDLTDTTATSDKVLDGEVFYTASGSRAVGTYVDSDTTDLTQMTGTLPIAHGGTGATTEAEARTNLGLGSAATMTVVNNGTTTSAGYVLDARYAKTITDQVIARTTGSFTAISSYGSMGSVNSYTKQNDTVFGSFVFVATATVSRGTIFMSLPYAPSQNFYTVCAIDGGTSTVGYGTFNGFSLPLIDLASGAVVRGFITYLTTRN